MSYLNPVKGVFDSVCSVSKFFSPLYPNLPLLYTALTIIFMILGIVGVIIFAIGKKFKNLARTIYAFVYLITSFFNMLIIFSATYCSLIIPTGEKVAGPEVPPATEPPTMIDRKHMTGGGGSYPIISKILTKVFGVINTIIENNNSPFIIIQVLCTCLIVIVTSFMSVIFSGISKAGYEMHCTDNNQVFSVPWYGKIIDFFMHLLLVISSVFVVLYSFASLATNGISTLIKYFVPKKDGNDESDPTQEVLKVAGPIQEVLKVAGLGNNSHVSQAINSAGVFMNDYPVVRAAFIISLSYYISQLILEMFQNIISNNIVLLTSWKKRETECSDEPKKESKVSMERGFILFCNIVLFIILCIITLGLIYVHLQFSPIINKGLGVVHKLYPNVSAQISVPFTVDGVIALGTRVSKSAGLSVNVDDMLNNGENKVRNLGFTGKESLNDLAQKALKSGINLQNKAKQSIAALQPTPQPQPAPQPQPPAQPQAALEPQTPAQPQAAPQPPDQLPPPQPPQTPPAPP